MNSSNGCRTPAAPAHILPVPPFPVIDSMQHIYTLMMMKHLSKCVLTNILEVSVVEVGDTVIVPVSLLDQR